MKPAKILIVDDDTNIRTSVRLCLEAAGFEVSQASNGAEALELIHSDSPDLVLVDLAMPVLDGMTVLAEIAIAAAGEAHAGDRDDGARLGEDRDSAVRLGASDF